MPVSAAPRRMLQWAACLEPGRYGFSSSKQATSTLAQALRLSPVYFHRAARIDRYGFEITAATEAGTTFVPTIYLDNGNLYPGALLLDVAPVASDTTGIKESTVDVVVPAGIVWVGGINVFVTTAPTFRVLSGSPPLGRNDAAPAQFTSAWSQLSITTAPSTFTTTLSPAGAAPRMFWRVAP